MRSTKLYGTARLAASKTRPWVTSPATWKRSRYRELGWVSWSSLLRVQRSEKHPRLGRLRGEVWSWEHEQGDPAIALYYGSKVGHYEQLIADNREQMVKELWRYAKKHEGHGGPRHSGGGPRSVCLSDFDTVVSDNAGQNPGNSAKRTRSTTSKRSVCTCPTLTAWPPVAVAPGRQSDTSSALAPAQST